MKIFIYANCQQRGIKAFLPLCLGHDRYEISSAENWMALAGMVDPNSFLPDVQKADILIYQPLDKGHGFFSTVEGEDNIMACTRKDCIKVSFPYIVNDGLWPCFENSGRITNGNAIDHLISYGASEDDVCRLYDEGALKFNLASRAATSLEKLKISDSKCDVAVAPIVADYRKSYKFLTQNHPTSIVFAATTQLICKHIFGREFHCPSVDNNNLAGLPLRYPIDRYAISELGLTYVNEPEPGAADFYKGLLRDHMRASQSAG